MMAAAAADKEEKLYLALAPPREAAKESAWLMKKDLLVGAMAKPAEEEKLFLTLAPKKATAATAAAGGARTIAAAGSLKLAN